MAATMASHFHYSLLAVFVVCFLPIKQTSTQSPSTQALIDTICANSAHDIPADYLFCQDFFQQNTLQTPDADINILNQISIAGTYKNATVSEKKVVEIWKKLSSDPKKAQLVGECDGYYKSIIGEYEDVMRAFGNEDFESALTHESNCPAFIIACNRAVGQIKSVVLDKLNLDVQRLLTMSLEALKILIGS